MIMRLPVVRVCRAGVCAVAAYMLWLPLSVSAQCIAPLPSLTHWWPGSGSTMDIVGQRNATLVNGATYASGQVGQAFSLDGASQNVAVADHPSLNVGTGDFSVNFWVSFSSLTGTQVLVEKYVSQTMPTGWSLIKTAGNTARLETPTTSIESGSLGLTTNTWYHFAAGRAGGTLGIIVNGAGVAIGSDSGDLSSASSLKFGKRGDPSDTPGSSDLNFLFLKGKIDEVQLHVGYALTVPEAQAIYNAGSNGQCPCGDGNVDANEGCDDGNIVDGDGCDRNCTTTACGNGIITTGEICDDGNLVNDDGCDANCTVTACGNTIQTSGEACDDGNAVEGDGCDTNCTLTACGNGRLSSGEVCDDGNLDADDLCQPDCTPSRCGDNTHNASLRCEPTITNACVDICADGWTAPFGVGVEEEVNSILVVSPDIYVAGQFNSADGNAAGDFIARWRNGVWSPLGPGMDGDVEVLAAIGTHVYAGGAFSSASGANGDVEAVALNGIGKWNGSQWSPLGAGTDGTIRALLVFGSDLYVGGDFTTAGTVSANSVAKWDGRDWSALSTGVDTTVNALVSIGSDIYAGGLFATAGGAAASNVAKWNGTAWSALGSGTPGEVFALAVLNDHLYAIGGNFIMEWDGATWSTLATTEIEEGLSAFVLHDELYVGGRFSSVDGVSAQNIAKYDGTNWSALGSGVGTERVGAIAANGNDLIVGGRFNSAGGLPASCLARWRDLGCGEQCDDGNTTSDDGCDGNCTLPACGNGIATTGEACDDGNDVNGDGCDINCTATACGNGIRTAPEACDDGNGTNGDGCEADCKMTPVSGIGSVSTPPASNEFPVQMSVTAPGGGMITIASPSSPQATAGFAVVGTQLDITAPPATVADPLVIVITIDASAIPPGFTADRIEVTRDGEVIDDCTGPTGQASPDPCIESRELLVDGDVELTMLTSHASVWSAVLSGLFKDEQKCVNGTAKGALGVVKVQAKTNDTCLKAAAKGGVDAAACLVNDTRGKLGKSMAKTTKAAAKCLPAPPFGFTTASTINNAAVQAGLDLTTALFGADLNRAVATNGGAAACQAALLKDMQSLLVAKLKLFLGCQKAGIAGKAGLFVSSAHLGSCFDVVTADVGGKIGKAAAKLVATVADKCAGLTQAAVAPGSCSGAADLAACLNTRVECRLCKMLTTMSGLSEDCDRFDDGAVNSTCS